MCVYLSEQRRWGRDHQKPAEARDHVPADWPSSWARIWDLSAHREKQHSGPRPEEGDNHPWVSPLRPLTQWQSWLSLIPPLLDSMPSSIAPVSISFCYVKNKPETQWLKTIILHVDDLGWAQLDKFSVLDWAHLCICVGWGLVGLGWPPPGWRLSAPRVSQHPAC